MNYSKITSPLEIKLISSWRIFSRTSLADTFLLDQGFAHFFENKEKDESQLQYYCTFI